MPDQPVRCQPDGLLARPDIPDHVRRKKRKFDQLLDAPFRDALGFRDLTEGFSRKDLIQIPVRMAAKSPSCMLRRRWDYPANGSFVPQTVSSPSPRFRTCSE